MSPGRKAEASDVRAWHGTVAASNELDSRREWVVWGVGPEAPSVLGGTPGNDIAEGIARAADEEWAAMGAQEKWIVTLTAGETDLEEILADSGSTRGHAPYLAPGKSEEMPEDGLMEGTLRNDVAPRRKVDQPRPSG
ncbi:MAG TPA: hypothetical protein VHJ78_07500 [Actinomycetota bacterium]|nr:hypothetical protein [Actinomycetota bacterium]